MCTLSLYKIYIITTCKKCPNVWKLGLSPRDLLASTHTYCNHTLTHNINIIMLTHCNFPPCQYLYTMLVSHVTCSTYLHHHSAHSSESLVSKKIHFVYVFYFNQYRSVGRAPIAQLAAATQKCAIWFFNMNQCCYDYFENVIINQYNYFSKLCYHYNYNYWRFFHKLYHYTITFNYKIQTNN